MSPNRGWIQVAATSAVFYPAGGTFGQKLRLLVGPMAVFAAVIGVWYLLSWRYLAPLLGRDGGAEENAADSADRCQQERFAEELD